ncbi:cytochrome C assembly family protein [Aggregatibacter actinomycetemcomitans]|uniref:cytochrome C assembly family protein n=1 Tax=Aggregatibacter actinomycetemcomitans TaxID=714 RepID=UPI00023FF9C4|nr:cytochrome c biogenesis protein CcsA [Aggregatibacter actinomycetemcomitans]EHK90742.1 CcmC protein [Aggregatibacter actinomycetemcomitans RhAA1]KNE77788.1 ABC transporter permease [Aggregatibacter actinomycetemcomitans RhAA1]
MWIAVLSIIFYLISVLFITPMLLTSQVNGGQTQPKKTPFFLTALFAIICHVFTTLPLLNDLANGQTFTLMEVASLMSVIIASLATLAMLRVNSMWFVLPIVYCFSMVNLVYAIFIPSHIIQLLNQNGSMLFHIGLSIFAYAVCCIATLYAIQLGWIDRRLKAKKMHFSPMVPPLMTVERHFFRLLVSGEILLTLTLISGSYHLMHAMTPDNLHKGGFSLLGWIVFGIAILGHKKYRWRGKKMIIYAISGMILLTIAYFGSRLIV